MPPFSIIRIGLPNAQSPFKAYVNCYVSCVLRGQNKSCLCAPWTWLKGGKRLKTALPVRLIHRIGTTPSALPVNKSPKAVQGLVGVCLTNVPLALGSYALSRFVAYLRSSVSWMQYS